MKNNVGMSGPNRFKVLLVEPEVYETLRQVVEKGCSVDREVAIAGKRMPLLFRCGGAPYIPALRRLIVGPYVFALNASRLDVWRHDKLAMAVNDVGYVRRVNALMLSRDDAIGKIKERLDGEIEVMPVAGVMDALSAADMLVGKAGVEIYVLEGPPPQGPSSAVYKLHIF
jgi:hypothetical protein